MGSQTFRPVVSARLALGPCSAVQSPITPGPGLQHPLLGTSSPTPSTTHCSQTAVSSRLPSLGLAEPPVAGGDPDRPSYWAWSCSDTRSTVVRLSPSPRSRPQRPQQMSGGSSWAWGDPQWGSTLVPAFPETVGRKLSPESHLDHIDRSRTNGLKEGRI